MTEVIQNNTATEECLVIISRPRMGLHDFVGIRDQHDLVNLADRYLETVGDEDTTDSVMERLTTKLDDIVCWKFTRTQFACDPALNDVFEDYHLAFKVFQGAISMGWLNVNPEIMDC
ncbi:MAG: hypothetical protein KC964_02015 [Candidatus Omnitrophica bacterium]|nr:hypothetical protein [Candidatus Omnitrophota bacterium]